MNSPNETSINTTTSEESSGLPEFSFEKSLLAKENAPTNYVSPEREKFELPRHRPNARSEVRKSYLHRIFADIIDDVKVPNVTPGDSRVNYGSSTPCVNNNCKLPINQSVCSLSPIDLIKVNRSDKKDQGDDNVNNNSNILCERNETVSRYSPVTKNQTKSKGHKSKENSTKNPNQSRKSTHQPVADNATDATATDLDRRSLMNIDHSPFVHVKDKAWHLTGPPLKTRGFVEISRIDCKDLNYYMGIIFNKPKVKILDTYQICPPRLEEANARHADLHRSIPNKRKSRSPLKKNRTVGAIPRPDNTDSGICSPTSNRRKRSLVDVIQVREIPKLRSKSQPNITSNTTCIEQPHVKKTTVSSSRDANMILTTLNVTNSSNKQPSPQKNSKQHDANMSLPTRDVSNSSNKRPSPQKKSKQRDASKCLPTRDVSSRSNKQPSPQKKSKQHDTKTPDEDLGIVLDSVQTRSKKQRGSPPKAKTAPQNEDSRTRNEDPGIVLDSAHTQFKKQRGRPPKAKPKPKPQNASKLQSVLKKLTNILASPTRTTSNMYADVIKEHCDPYDQGGEENIVESTNKECSANNILKSVETKKRKERPGSTSPNVSPAKRQIVTSNINAPTEENVVRVKLRSGQQNNATIEVFNNDDIRPQELFSSKDNVRNVDLRQPSEQSSGSSKAVAALKSQFKKPLNKAPKTKPLNINNNNNPKENIAMQNIVIGQQNECKSTSDVTELNSAPSTSELKKRGRMPRIQNTLNNNRPEASVEVQNFVPVTQNVECAITAKKIEITSARPTTTVAKKPRGRPPKKKARNNNRNKENIETVQKAVMQENEDIRTRNEDPGIVLDSAQTQTKKQRGRPPKAKTGPQNGIGLIAKTAGRRQPSSKLTASPKNVETGLKVAVRKATWQPLVLLVGLSEFQMASYAHFSNGVHFKSPFKNHTKNQKLHSPAHTKRKKEINTILPKVPEAPPLLPEVLQDNNQNDIENASTVVQETFNGGVDDTTGALKRSSRIRNPTFNPRIVALMTTDNGRRTSLKTRGITKRLSTNSGVPKTRKKKRVTTERPEALESMIEEARLLNERRSINMDMAEDFTAEVASSNVPNIDGNDATADMGHNNRILTNITDKSVGSNKESTATELDESEKFVHISQNDSVVRKRWFFKSGVDTRIQKSKSYVIDRVPVDNGVKSGRITIFPKCKKPSVVLKNHNVTFYVMRGTGQFHIQNKSAEINEDTYVKAFDGNEYSIHNTGAENLSMIYCSTRQT